MDYYRALTTRAEYYGDNLYLFKKLINGLLLQDPNLFLYAQYPLLPQNITPPSLTEYLTNAANYPNYTGFTYIVNNTNVLSENGGYLMNLMNQMTIMNVYYPAFNITLNNITIQSYFVAFQGMTSPEPQLILTYPAGYNKYLPFLANDSWYSRAVETTGTVAFYFDYNPTENKTILTISQILQDANGNTIGVVGLDLDMQNLHLNFFANIYIFSNASYNMAFVDQYGTILNFPTILNLSPGKANNYFYNICGLSNESYNLMISNTIIGTSGAYSSTSKDITGQGNLIFDAIRLPFPTEDPYFLVGFYQNGESDLLDAASEIIGSTLGWFMLYSALVSVALFILMMVVALAKSTTFLEPLTIISKYAIESSDQSVLRAKKDEKEKDKFTKEISKLEDGSDEVGELVKYFRRLISGLNALKKDVNIEEHEAETPDTEESTNYPRNFLKNSRMPWREQLKLLMPKATAQQQLDEKNKSMNSVMNMLRVKNNLLNKSSL
jgi:hypothetical protein